MAQANAKPRKPIRTVEIGDGWALAGFEIVPLKDEEGGMAAGLMAIGCKPSPLVPVDRFYPVLVTVLAGIDVEKMKEGFRMAAGEVKPEAMEES